MAGQIKFGTDGWRGLIADDFTFENVRKCAQGLADYLKSIGIDSQGVVIGYDTRFLSKDFADAVASVLAGSNIKVYLCTKAAPTPVVSFNVLHYRAAGAVIITASHNPHNWNGFKFKPEYAGSATQEITDALECKIDLVNVVHEIPLGTARSNDLLVDIDPDPPYIKSIEEQVSLKFIKEAGLHVGVDSMFGSGSGYIKRLLSGGLTTVRELHSEVNPSFPGMEQPEPIAHNLLELSNLVIDNNLSVGIALDGDADRVGIISDSGSFVSTLETFSLLAWYMLEHKGERGDIVKGITSSHMLNKLASKYGVDVHEMRVGFKFIGPKMSETNAVIGGEESGGFAFRGHIPERDGILSGLLLLENIATTGKSVSDNLSDLFDIVGHHSYERRDIKFDLKEKNTLIEKLNACAAQTHIGDQEILGCEQLDGVKLLVTDGWIASRFSGTEPLLRIYCEADSDQRVAYLLDLMQDYLGVRND